MKRFGVIAASMLAIAIAGCSNGSRGVPAFVENFLTTDVRVETDVAGAAASAKQRICCANGVLYVVWVDVRNGQNDVFFNKSTDGGRTWLAADVRLNTDAAGASVADDPEITCRGQSLWVVWEDARDGEKDIRLQRSTDGGNTWLGADVRLDQDAAGAAASGDPLVSVSQIDGRSLTVLFEDDRNGSRDILIRSSADGGVTWTNETLVNANGAGTSQSDRPRLSRVGTRLYVTWMDNRNGNNDVFFNTSADNGATWLAADVRLDTDAAGAAFSFDPAIDVDGQNIYVAWVDNRAGALDIHFNRSTDGGTTWQVADQRLDTDVAGAANSFRPIVACAQGNVYVTWIDQRSGTSDIFVATSNDRAETFNGDLRLDTDASAAGGVDFVQIRAAGNNAYVTWEDTRDGARDVRFTATTDGGESWRDTDLRLDTDAAGAADSRLPRLDIDADQVYVVWRDSRNGQNDIYANSSLRR